MRLFVFAIFTALVAATGARAATETVIHSFCLERNCFDGNLPQGGLLRDAAGNIYGTASGGISGQGVVFQLSQRPGGHWRYRVIYNFCSRASCTDGAFPDSSSLIIDTSGRLYGVAAGGGLSNGYGTVFRLTPHDGRKNWTLETLYDFCYRTNNCRDGAYPDSKLAYAGASAGLPYDGTSPLYGVTVFGGLHLGGIAYSLTPVHNRWKLTVLHQFCSVKPNCLDGSTPFVPLTLDGAGNLYGATQSGGATGSGLIYKLSPGTGHQWTETVLHELCSEADCADGAGSSALVIGADGNLYGFMGGGGGTTPDCPQGCGTLFKLSPTGTLTSLYHFCSQHACVDGAAPFLADGPVLDAAGNLFGMTREGGKHRGGVLFEYSGTAYSVLHDFCSKHDCVDGARPTGLIQDPSGTLWGMTNGGGDADQGVVFKLEP